MRASLRGEGHSSQSAHVGLHRGSECTEGGGEAGAGFEGCGQEKQPQSLERALWVECLS